MKKQLIIADNPEQVREILEELEESEDEEKEERKRLPSPFKVESRPPEDGEAFTTITEVRESYTEDFVIEAVHEAVGKKFKFLCKRKNIFDLMSDKMDGVSKEDTTMRMAYEEALEIIIGTVVVPDAQGNETQLTYEDVSNIPFMFILSIKNAIMAEISPGFGFEDDDEDESEEDVKPEEDAESAEEAVEANE